jgi:hypothetical protein
VRGIGEVLRRVDRSVHPVALLNWFTLPDPDLHLDEGEERAVSPREWLLSGGSPETICAPGAGALRIRRPSAAPVARARRR